MVEKLFKVKLRIMMSMFSATAGIYAVGYQIGMIISMLTTAFNKEWSPYMFKILSNNPTMQDKRRVVKFTYIYFLAILFITFAFAFQSMYFMVTNYIFYVKKTYILAYVTFSTALVHIGLLYICKFKWCNRCSTGKCDIFCYYFCFGYYQTEFIKCHGI